MKTHLPPVVLLCLFAMSCAGGDAPLKPRAPVSTYGSAVENVRDIPIEGVFFNECCGEDVYVTGTAHFVVSKSFFHIVVQNMTGTGLSSGLSYAGRGASTESNIFYSDPYEGTFTFGINLVNEDGCSFKVTVKNHITTNANGDITVIMQRFETRCH